MTRRTCVLALVVAVSALAGCTGQNPPGAAPTSQPAASPSQSGSQVIDDAPVVLADGRHPVFVTAVDVPGLAITFDLIQFLTGAAAKAAWDSDHPGEPGPPNDYYIVNVNPRLRTLPVSTSVTITVVKQGEPGAPQVPATLAELPSHAASDGLPFWLTVSGGQITLIEEQYLP